jgi:hypothetical protein
MILERPKCEHAGVVKQVMRSAIATRLGMAVLGVLAARIASGEKASSHGRQPRGARSAGQGGAGQASESDKTARVSQCYRTMTTPTRLAEDKLEDREGEGSSVVMHQKLDAVVVVVVCW